MSANELCNMFFDYLNSHSKSHHQFNDEMWCMVIDFNYQEYNMVLFHLLSFETLDVITFEATLKSPEFIISAFAINSTLELINCCFTNYYGKDCCQFDNVNICTYCHPINTITHVDILDQFYCIDEDNHITITNSSVCSTPEITEHYVTEIYNTYVDSSHGLIENILTDEEKQVIRNKIMSQIPNTDIVTGPDPLGLPIPSF
jgi:hypothetical protein